MRIGISAYDMTAPDLLELATAADELGFHSLWLGEHLVLPVDYRSVHPTKGSKADEHHTGPLVAPGTELLDPFVALAAVAGRTRGLVLATGIYILPLRHPLLTARAAATLQQVSGGRLLLGLGAGWLAEEFDAFGVPFDERVSRFEESVAVLRKAWAGGPFEHAGAHFTFPRIQVTTEPVEVPLVIGGNTDRALRRAVAVGDAWFSSGTPKWADALALRDRIAALCAAQGRDRLPMYFRVEGCDPKAIERYASEGIEDVTVWADQVWPTGATLDVKHKAIAAAADALGLEGQNVRG